MTPDTLQSNCHSVGKRGGLSASVSCVDVWLYRECGHVDLTKVRSSLNSTDLHDSVDLRQVVSLTVSGGRILFVLF